MLPVDFPHWKTMHSYFAKWNEHPKEQGGEDRPRVLEGAKSRLYTGNIVFEKCTTPERGAKDGRDACVFLPLRH